MCMKSGDLRGDELGVSSLANIPAGPTSSAQYMGACSWRFGLPLGTQSLLYAHVGRCACYALLIWAAAYSAGRLTWGV